MLGNIADAILCSQDQVLTVQPLWPYMESGGSSLQSV